MPRGDRSGPVGMGAMTGRAAGYCAGFGVPGYANAGVGRGLGQGFGRGRGFGGGGRGWRNWFYASDLPAAVRFGGYPAPSYYPMPYGKPAPAVEKQALEQQAEALQSELDFIKKRLSEIDTETTTE